MQDLHKTVSIRMVMDAATLTLIPTEQHQIELSIALVNQISGISVRIKLGIFSPVSGVASVG